MCICEPTTQITPKPSGHLCIEIWATAELLSASQTDQILSRLQAFPHVFPLPAYSSSLLLPETLPSGFSLGVTSSTKSPLMLSPLRVYVRCPSSRDTCHVALQWPVNVAGSGRVSSRRAEPLVLSTSAPGDLELLNKNVANKNRKGSEGVKGKLQERGGVWPQALEGRAQQLPLLGW